MQAGWDAEAARRELKKPNSYQTCKNARDQTRKATPNEWETLPSSG